MDRNDESFGTVLVHVDEERLEAIENSIASLEVENKQLRRETDGLWKLLFEVLEGHFAPSSN